MQNRQFVYMCGEEKGEEGGKEEWRKEVVIPQKR